MRGLILLSFLALAACSHPDGYIQQSKWVPERCYGMIGQVGRKSCIPAHVEQIWVKPIPPEPVPDVTIVPVPNRS